MKILNFGSCNIDYVYSLDHIVAPGETETTYKLEVFPGGKGLNQSIAAAKAGAEVYHAGCVGTESEILTDILQQSRVDISYISKKDIKSGHAIIQVTGLGENSIFIYPGANETVSRDYIDSVLENFGSGDIVLLQNEISNVKYIIEKAYEKHMCIILNPSPFNEKLKEIDFNNLTYIILNEVEANAISGSEEVEVSLRYLKNKYLGLKIVLTLGSNGSIYSDSELELQQPAFKVKAVDTTAAGDTFTGYFIAGLASGAEYKEIMRLSAAAAAIAVSKKGAAPSIPDKEEVLSAVDGMTENLKNEKSENIRRQIEGYMAQSLKTGSLKGLSEKLGYSVSYTGSLVKEYTGMSFSKAIQLKRCAAAAESLKQTELTVEEIANGVGYENVTFFRKIFKEKYGKNPLEFRKKR